MANCLSSIFLAISVTTIVMPVTADTVSGMVYVDGTALADVVVTATPSNYTGKAAQTETESVSMALDQKSREFVPHVLAVRTGTPVFFPNSDDIRHHVYSFSQAKRFELKLYKGTPKVPIVFNHPGIVALGCNIHDWMLGYIFVTDSPYLTKTDVFGHWSLELPKGNYQIVFWHSDSTAVSGLTGESIHVPLDRPLHHNLNLKARRQSGKPPNSLQVQGYKDGF